MAVSFIEETGVPGQNHRHVASRLQTFIALCCIEYTLPWAGYELTNVVVICTNCIGNYTTTIRSRPWRHCIGSYTTTIRSRPCRPHTPSSSLFIKVIAPYIESLIMSVWNIYYFKPSIWLWLSCREILLICHICILNVQTYSCDRRTTIVHSCDVLSICELEMNLCDVGLDK